MNVIIVSYNNGVTHLAAELELAETHLQQGDAVTFLACDGSVGACVVNPHGSADLCRECRLRRADGISQLSGDVSVYSLKAHLIPRKLIDRVRLPPSPTVADYKSLRYRGQDLGWGALSTVNYLYRDPLCDSKEAMQAARTFMDSAIRSYEGTRRFLGKHSDFDRGYVFNGRFAVTRGAFRALQEANIEVYTHERGSSKNHYQLFPNTFPHDQKLFQERVRASWEMSTDQVQRDKIANQFFQAQKKGKPLNEMSFIQNQNFGDLPKDWDVEKLNVVIFNSSEDELAAVSDLFTDPVYPSQADAVEKIVADTLASGKLIHYYLRIHPNLAGVENSSLASLLAVSSPNLTIIDADDSISTYCLLEACDCVLTFGSTVGVEATYWGKPSILTGKSRYDELDVAYRPHSHEEVMELLLKDQLPPKERIGALKYGYYVRTRGTLFEHWKPRDLHSGTFGNLFMGDGVVETNKRSKQHGKIYLFLLSLLRSKRYWPIADALARKIEQNIYRMKKLGTHH